MTIPAEAGLTNDDGSHDADIGLISQEPSPRKALPTATTVRQSYTTRKACWFCCPHLAGTCIHAVTAGCRNPLQRYVCSVLLVRRRRLGKRERTGQFVTGMWMGFKFSFCGSQAIPIFECSGAVMPQRSGHSKQTQTKGFACVQFLALAATAIHDIRPSNFPSHHITRISLCSLVSK